MKPNEIVEALGPWIDRVSRPAWRPLVEEGDGPPTASKYCGIPWTGPDAPWPECTGCKIPLTLALQLRLDELPSADAEYGRGLLQFFFCRMHGEGGCETEYAYLPFSDQSTRVRIIDPVPEGDASSPPPGYKPPIPPPQRIVGWERFEDRPGYFEREENGLIVDFDVPANKMRMRCPEVGLDVVTLWDNGFLDDFSQAALDDKLGGWPRWVQRLEYPECPECGRRMRLVFQLTSHDHLQDGFSDYGYGYLTQCPEHKHVVAFGSSR